jgi:hypothetical protein
MGLHPNKHKGFSKGWHQVKEKPQLALGPISKSGITKKTW